MIRHYGLLYLQLLYSMSTRKPSISSKESTSIELSCNGIRSTSAIVIKSILINVFVRSDLITMTVLNTFFSAYDKIFWNPIIDTLDGFPAYAPVWNCTCR
ncbi:MAG: hypothetical protein WCD89_17900 [Anaerocolumna sp.]